MSIHTAALLYAPKLDRGGVETHVLALMRHGAPAGYRWLIVAAASEPFAQRAMRLGARIVPWAPAHALDLRALRDLVRILRSESADLVHAHSPRAALLARAAARVAGIPAVVTVHVTSYDAVRGQNPGARLKRTLYRAAERAVNRVWPDPLIYCSFRIHAETIARGIASRRLACVIPNGIDLDVGGAPLPDLRSRLGTPHDATVLLGVGRLDPQKGFDLLLEAFRSLEPERGRVHLWLAGDGPDRRILEARVCALHLSPWVHFLGFRDDVPALLMSSDLFVLPSRFEAMPMALLEAMAAGRPAVVTDVGDNAELVGHGLAGLVVPPEDSRALAAALEALVRNPSRRAAFGLEAQRRSAAFRADRMARKVLHVYNEALHRR
ncbi:MAG: glycosyltransferase family 4 protein [Planctomycetes bacterium]|nr:glycosyltransferase family 4 protein [Planctomycetota bacterium]